MAIQAAEAMELLGKVGESFTVRTVIGEPVTQDGVTVIPVAKVSGGGGGGGGTGPSPSGEESGGTGVGFGISSRPVGVFVIKEGKVSWRPAVDVNKVIMGGQIVAIVALFTLRAVVKARRRRPSDGREHT
jgi:uncharacterized spore protein YtfJ